MDEQLWLQAIEIFPLMDAVRENASERKLRLFACACVRRISHLLPSDLCRAVIDVAERHADAMASVEELRESATEAYFSKTVEGYEPDVIVAELARSAIEQLAGHLDDPWETVYGSSSYPLEAIGGGPQQIDAEEQRSQCDLFRDVFGNPFRPVAIDPRWQSSTVIDLAKIIYAENAFDRLPILADALMDAGCDNEEIIGHCQQLGEHVRGCWVIDRLLGKE